LGGCVIPLHVDEEEPFTNVAGELLDGLTLREEVLAVYGEPTAIYSHGSIYIYSAYEKNWEFPYLLVAPYSRPAAGVGHAGKRHFLILEFDERGILINHKLEIGNGRADCSDSGICHGKAAAGHVVWLADKKAETEAREFPISGNQCGFYLYIEGYSLSDQISVALNGEGLGQVNLVGSGFFYILVDPGRHAIAADQITPNPDSVMLQVTCKVNEHIFVRMKIKGAKSSPALLELVGSSEGRKKIKRRRLIVPQSSH